MSDSLTPDPLRKMDAYWCASNYLSVGQIYLRDDPLLAWSYESEQSPPRLGPQAWDVPDRVQRELVAVEVTQCSTAKRKVSCPLIASLMRSDMPLAR